MASRSRVHHNRKQSRNGSCIPILALLGLLCFIGLIYSFLLYPTISNDVAEGLNTNTIVTDQNSKSLSLKILEWLPHTNKHITDEYDMYPDYKQEFWSPIDVDVTYDPMITLCKLNFKEYSESPHLYPMFRDLEKLSGCQGNNKKKEYLSVLMKEINSKKGNLHLLFM